MGKYIYRKEIDWSVLNDGFTLPIENKVVQGYFVGNRIIARGETVKINFFLDGKTYEVSLYNVNNPIEKRKTDAYQIRYTVSSEFSKAMRTYFSHSFNYIKAQRELREKGDRKRIRVPEEAREYLAIYTSEYDDTFELDVICNEDILAVKSVLKDKNEKTIEDYINTDDGLIGIQLKDSSADILLKERLVKIRKLNRKIGDNLKQLYGYRCQICGKLVGEKYGCSHIAEAHHIDYFTKSLNNDSSNQMVVCPNHHRIIHDAEPTFDRQRKLFVYENKFEEGLALNEHL